MTHSHTQPDDVVMASYSDLPEAVRDHLASLEIFIGDMGDLELRNGDVIDSSVLVPAFNGIVAALRATPAQPAGMREAQKVRERLIQMADNIGGFYAAEFHKLAALLALPAERPAVAQGAPEGWRLVPIHPTPEMQRAGFLALDYGADCNCDQKDVWDAMVSSVPSTESK